MAEISFYCDDLKLPKYRIKTFANVNESISAVKKVNIVLKKPNLIESKLSSENDLIEYHLNLSSKYVKNTFGQVIIYLILYIISREKLILYAIGDVSFLPDSNQSCSVYVQMHWFPYD